MDINQAKAERRKQAEAELKEKMKEAEEAYQARIKAEEAAVERDWAEYELEISVIRQFEARMVEVSDRMQKDAAKRFGIGLEQVQEAVSQPVVPVEAAVADDPLIVNDDIVTPEKPMSSGNTEANKAISDQQKIVN